MSLLFAAATLTLGASAWASPANCLIFVHGTDQDSANYLYNPAGALAYWEGGVAKATVNGAKRYVVHYNGDRPWYEGAADVSAQINAALDGAADGSGGSCAGASAFVVIAHSMGATVLDFILGNSSPGDPNYNWNGNYSRIASSIAYVITLSGAHRGSEYADAACGNGYWLGCDIVAPFIEDCTPVIQYLQTADAYRVETYSNAPDKAVYLIQGGSNPYDGGCLADPHDGAIAYVSGFACAGDPTADWSFTSQCANTYKQETGNFFNVDHTVESHSQTATGARLAATRKCSTDNFLWPACSPGATVASQSSPDLLGSMY